MSPVDSAIGLDLFANQIVTIVPRKAIIHETPESLARRAANAKELPVRLVRDVEGIALAVDGAVVAADHIAPLLCLKPNIQTPTLAQFYLANGIEVHGATRTRDLIMDGNIGAQF